MPETIENQLRQAKRELAEAKDAIKRKDLVLAGMDFETIPKLMERAEQAEHTLSDTIILLDNCREGSRYADEEHLLLIKKLKALCDSWYGRVEILRELGEESILARDNLMSCIADVICALKGETK